MDAASPWLKVGYRVMNNHDAKRRIAIVTSSRADYCHLYWPLRALADRDDVQVLLIVTGAHLSPEFGMTVRAIESDGFPIAERIECLLSSDSDAAMGKTIGLATISFTDSLARMSPDLLLIIADRYEMLAPAMAALALRIPIAHIEGGELSEGAIDQQVRNALTMLSHIHLVTTEQAKQRLLAMGEQPHRVHRVGAASLDHLTNSTLLSRNELESSLDFTLPRDLPILVVGLHPVTIERDTTLEVDAVFAALDEVDDCTIVFCFPNADAGSRQIMDRARGFCDRRKHAQLFVNIQQHIYWSLLQHASLMLGNSSSGIMESPSLGLPAINIGTRQQGRERAANVIDAAPVETEIRQAIQRALSDEFRSRASRAVNPYGDGQAAKRIATLLATHSLDRDVTIKRGLAIPESAVDPATTSLS